MELEKKIIGFMGGGNMATALVNGILKIRLVADSQILVSCQSESTFDKWNRRGINVTLSNSELVEKSDVVVLAVKPHQLSAAMDGMKFSPSKPLSSKLFVSVLAGISSDVIYNEVKSHVQRDCRVIRVVPNTPLMVEAGCSAISVHPSATPEDVDFIRKIFSSLGKAEILNENQMSAVTGLSGSGPAYIYTIIEAMSDGGVKQGLPRNIAIEFAAQTAFGAAKMVLETRKHPGQLKDEVCSPGGTTIHGLHALEKSGVRAALMNAVEAACERSKEIGSANVFSRESQ